MIFRIIQVGPADYKGVHMRSSHKLTDKARRAVDCLRDFAREHGMHHRERDPLVLDIHRALDEFDEMFDAMTKPASSPSTEER